MRTRLILSAAFTAVLLAAGPALSAKPGRKNPPPPAVHKGAPPLTFQELKTIDDKLVLYRKMMCFFGPTFKRCATVSPDAPAWLVDDLGALNGRDCFDAAVTEGAAWALAFSIPADFLGAAIALSPKKSHGFGEDPKGAEKLLKSSRDGFAKQLEAMKQSGFQGSLQGRGALLLGDFLYLREKMDEALAALAASDGGRLRLAFLAIAWRADALHAQLVGEPPEPAVAALPQCTPFPELLDRFASRPPDPAGLRDVMSLARSYADAGRPADSIKVYDLAVSQADALALPEARQVIHAEAAGAALKAEDLDGALDHMEAALAISRDRADLYSEYNLLTTFAGTLTGAGRRPDRVERFVAQAQKIRERLELSAASVSRGDRYMAQGRYAEAKKEYLQSTEIGNGLAYLRVAACEEKLGNMEAAAASYQTVLGLAKAQKNKDWEAAAEYALWKYHYDRGDTLKAIDSLEALLRLGLSRDAAALTPQMRDRLDERRAADMGALESQYNLADAWPRAERLYKELYDRAVELGRSRDAFHALLHLGRVQSESGSPERGVGTMTSALKALMSTRDTDTSDMVALYRSLSDMQAYWNTELRTFALFFNSTLSQLQAVRSKAIADSLADTRGRKKSDPAALAAILTAAADDTAGKQPEKALAFTEEALGLAVKLKRADLQIRLYRRLSVLERRLGSLESANADLERALGLALWGDARPLAETDPTHARALTAVRLKIGDPEVTLPLVRDLGFAYLDAGSPLSAIDFVKLSLELEPNDWQRIQTLQAFARLLSGAGLREQAVSFFTRMLDEERVQTVPRVKAAVLHELASVRAKTGGLGQDFALESMEKAYLMLKPRGLTHEDLKLMLFLGSLRLKKGKTAEAVQLYEEAIAISEAFRASLASESARLAFLEKDPAQFDNYRLAVGGLMQAAAKDGSYLARAFAASEKARARVLLEALGGADLRAEGPLHDEETAVVQRISLLAQKGLSEGFTLTEQIQQSALQDRLSQITAEMRRTDPRYAELKYPQPATLDDLQRALKPGEAVISYKLAGDGNAWAFLVTPESARLYNLDEIMNADPPAPAAGSDDEERAKFQRLGKIFWSPFEAALSSAGVTRVFVVPDGAMWRMPFSAFETAKGVLVDQPYTIQMVPSASVLVEFRREKPSRQKPTGELAAFAPYAEKDVAGKPKKGRKDTPLLPGSFAVLDKVKAAFPDAQVFTPPEATKDRALASTGFRRMLFYTHGFADEDTPWFSSIMFRDKEGKDVPLTVTEAMRSLHLEKTDLVVLSACQTARGVMARGEGVMGLTRGLFYAGARGVIATNWSVAELPTRDLVGDLFDGLKAGMTSAKALQEAQRKVRKRTYFGKSGEHPYLWAGFALYGDPD